MKLTIRIDGKEISLEKGTMLLSAARRAGIHIPALCHHEALEPYGSCRLCLVEIRNGDRTRMTTSCNYPVLHDGETVSTDSGNVLKARAIVMELLLARCPDSEPIRKMARSMGIESSRFPAVTPSHLAGDDDALRNCILCGLCVRACAEAIGASAISFADRGPNRQVASPFYVSSETCTGCGACAEVCPTGIIRIVDSPEGLRRLPFLKIEVPLRLCGGCGKHFAPEAQLAGTDEKVPSVSGKLELCSVCRRKEFSTRLSRWKAATS